MVTETSATSAFPVIDQRIFAWLSAARLLISAGAATINSIRNFFRAAGLTEEEINAILVELGNDIERRRAISAHEAGLS